MFPRCQIYGIQYDTLSQDHTKIYWLCELKNLSEGGAIHFLDENGSILAPTLMNHARTKIRRHRITKHGDFLVWKGSQWVKDAAASSDPTKIRRWREMESKRKKDKGDKSEAKEVK